VENEDRAGPSAAGAVAPRRAYACELAPELTDGPYHPPRDVVRKDLTEGRTGVPMALRIRVVDAAGGDPIPGAVLEVWHCDALGLYSGDDTVRGVRTTDDRGYAEFSTIFPGWYAGRAVHVHAEVRVAGREPVAHTGQFFVAEDLTRSVAQLAPYRRNRTARTTNGQDAHYTAGGSAGMLTVVPRDRYHLADGLLATVTVAVDPDANPTPA
jgi:protocatechuate 3,4-dioxygenase beta subunit